MRRMIAVVGLLVVAVACGKDSPSAPTPPVASATRIIRLGGNLSFGNVTVGDVRSDGILTISNDGNAALNYTGITGPCSAISALNPTSGTVQPGQTTQIGIRFAPTAVLSCTGVITVAGDQTSGTNTIQMTASGVTPPRPTFTRTGVGDSVFDMPADVARVRIIGIYNGYSSNFIVRIGGRLIVNELIGDGWGSRRYDGTLLTGGGGIVAITSSSGVQWSFEEIGR